MAGVLCGIARHARPRGPVETVNRARVSVETGLDGDCRGIVKPGGRGRRQLTLMTREGWRAAIAELGCDVAWEQRRANLLVDDMELAGTAGRRVRIGAVVLRVTMECDPCSRMDAVAPGLRRALEPDWRGGVCTRVEQGGEIAVGDRVEWEPS